MASVNVRDLSKSFGAAVKAVERVSFTIPDRAFLTLLGPSGCGKSTVLRLIAGLEEATSGDILIDDARINDLPPAARDIAMVFQSYALYPHMTCFENIAVSLRLRKIPAAEIARRVNEVAELLGVSALLARKPNQLSGGERQRIAMGRALVRRPKVLLLDEPLSNLDAQLRERMRTELKRLFIEMRTTVVYVTHDQAEAMSMSDIIVVLRDGRLQQQGTPTEIYRQPANLFVASFLGSPRINTIKGELRNSRFIAADFELGGIEIAENGPVVLGVRPEHIEISLNHNRIPDNAQDLIIAGQVEIVEPLGMHNKVVARVGRESFSLLSAAEFEIGAAINLSFHRDQLLFFHHESGARIAQKLATNDLAPSRKDA